MQIVEIAKPETEEIDMSSAEANVYHCKFSISPLIASNSRESRLTPDQIKSNVKLFSTMMLAADPGFPWKETEDYLGLKPVDVCDFCGGAIYIDPAFTPNDLISTASVCSLYGKVEFWIRESTCDQR